MEIWLNVGWKVSFFVGILRLWTLEVAREDWLLDHNVRNIKVLNIWGMESVLGITFKALEHVDTFTVLNVNGLYLNRIPFWDNVFNNLLLRGDLAIIGGDLNFSLGQSKVWGPHACADLLTNYFTQELVERKYLDIEPMKLKPT